MYTINRMGWSGIGSIAALAMAGAVACSSSSNNSSPAPAAPVDAAVFDAPSAPDEGTSGEVTLQVLNFLSWCSVTINGGAASTAASVTASVATGSTATIVVTPSSSAFTIGPEPWFGVTQNGGAAAPGMDKVEKLAHGEIARMRRHNVEKAGLHIGVTEGAEVGELGFDNGHWL